MRLDVIGHLYVYLPSTIMTSVVRCLLGQQSQLHLYHEAKCLQGAVFIPSPEAGSKNPVGNAAAYCQQHALHKAHHKSGACMGPG